MFEASRLKVKRANKHITELVSVVEAYINSDFCSFSIQPDTNGGQRFVAKIVKELPCDVPLIIGDAVHNLRAALDILICDVVRNTGGTPTKYTKFPVFETRQELVGAINGGLVKVIGEVMVTAIVDTIKPYRQGGDATICALHDIDIDDKHLLILPIVRGVDLLVSKLIIKQNGRTVMTMTDSRIGVGSRGEINVVGFGPGPASYKLEGDIKPTFDIFFQDGEPFGGKPVIPTLHQISNLISGVIAIIENIPPTHGASP